jgi:hypothetical protein
MKQTHPAGFSYGIAFPWPGSFARRRPVVKNPRQRKGGRALLVGNLIVASNPPPMNVGIGGSLNFLGKRCLIGPARGLRSKICLGPAWLQPGGFAH